jgi:hypothetical protein
MKIKNFVEKLHASSINSGRQNVSLGLMKSNDPTVWAQFEEMAINGWDSQPEWNNALNRVKNEIRRDYSLDWAPNVDKSLFEFRTNSRRMPVFTHQEMVDPTIGPMHCSFYALYWNSSRTF